MHRYDKFLSSNRLVNTRGIALVRTTEQAMGAAVVSVAHIVGQVVIRRFVLRGMCQKKC